MPEVAEPGRADVRWSIVAQSAVKPRNDSFFDAGVRRWRANEDRFHVRQGADGVAAAVADGAGSSGLFCGAWAEALVTRLPDRPIIDLPELDAWLAGFSLDFRREYTARLAADPAKRAKFVREGSCATLAACWLGLGGDGPELDWLAYGDSPLLVFDRGTVPPRLVACHPARLAAFDRDPHLLNWRDVPVAAGLGVGHLALPAAASVILASDAIGQSLLWRHFAAGSNGAGDPMAEEFQGLCAAESRLSTAARAHLARPADTDLIAGLRRHLGSQAAFSAMMRQSCVDGLLANDDATVVLIDVDVVPARNDAAEGGDDPECHCRLCENPGS